MERKLILRPDKIAFAGIPDASTGEVTTYHRMRGFKNLSTSKNSTEYTRKYTDMRQEVTDVVGMSESKAFEFDQYVNDPVHDYIASIFEEERLGSAANIVIVTVDMTKGATGNNAVKRTYSVIPDTHGDGTEAYVYTGRFVATNAVEKAKATVAEDGLTATITAGV